MAFTSTFELLETIGVDARAVGSSGGALAFSKIYLNFLAPLRSGDKFVVKTRVSQSAARLFFKNFIYKLPNKEPILEAKSVVVFLDKNYRPLRIPSDVKSKLRQFMRHDQES
ncbi:hypothetical protein BVRB_9g211740 [Beta vulgaris subsp. vulgaris]|nr:hypothetical protein BVRB_9g211740 [Beta vulgaris subsp. vulgaris]